MKINFILNDEEVSYDANPGETLFELLRRYHNYEVKGNNCKSGECGACTVLVDDKPVPSCTLLVGKVIGKKVTTIKGIGDLDKPNIIQKSFVSSGAIQCGYCIPGIILSVYSYIKKGKDFSKNKIKETLSSHLCRCTGYVQQIEAVENAIKKLMEEKNG